MVHLYDGREVRVYTGGASAGDYADHGHHLGGQCDVVEVAGEAAGRYLQHELLVPPEGVGVHENYRHAPGHNTFYHFVCSLVRLFST